LTLLTFHSSNVHHDTLFPEKSFYYHFHNCNEAPLSVSTAVCPLTKHNVSSHTLCTAVCPLTKHNVTYHTLCTAVCPLTEHNVTSHTLCTIKSTKELSSNFQISFNGLECWLWDCRIVTTHLKTITLLSAKARQAFTMPS
jgi:hypothetical protein